MTIIQLKQIKIPLWQKCYNWPCSWETYITNLSSVRFGRIRLTATGVPRQQALSISPKDPYGFPINQKWTFQYQQSSKLTLAYFLTVNYKQHKMHFIELSTTRHELLKAKGIGDLYLFCPRYSPPNNPRPREKISKGKKCQKLSKMIRSSSLKFVSNQTNRKVQENMYLKLKATAYNWRKWN